MEKPTNAERATDRFIYQLAAAIPDVAMLLEEHIRDKTMKSCPFHLESWTYS